MIILLQVDNDVSEVWDVKSPTPGLNFEHEWKIVRDNVRRESGDTGYFTDDIIDRMKRMGWWFEEVVWGIVKD